MTINNFGDKVWRLSNGDIHRENGPAVEYTDGSKAWWTNGKRHRAGGPAIDFSNGHKEWWSNGKFFYRYASND